MKGLILSLQLGNEMCIHVFYKQTLWKSMLKELEP